MKHLFFTGCIMIILIFISCRKDSVNNVTHLCSNCQVDTPSAQHWSAIYITDSNWARQGQQVYKSDLTQLLNEAGATVSEVYTLQLVDDAVLFNLFPCCQINYRSGEISASVYGTGNEETCTLTFTYSDQDTHAGEFAGLPFQSILVKVWLWK
jgi:hypothetical protein